MAKIGFIDYQGDDKTKEQKDKDVKEVAKKVADKVLSAEDADKKLVKQFIADNYAPSGDRRRLLLYTTRDIVFVLHNHVSTTEEVVGAVLTELGFSTMVFEGEPCWKLYELYDYGF
jgi:hypothetical protein